MLKNQPKRHFIVRMCCIPRNAKWQRKNNLPGGFTAIPFRLGYFGYISMLKNFVHSRKCISTCFWDRFWIGSGWVGVSWTQIIFEIGSRNLLKIIFITYKKIWALRWIRSSFGCQESGWEPRDTPTFVVILRYVDPDTISSEVWFKWDTNWARPLSSPVPNYKAPIKKEYTSSRK